MIIYNRPEVFAGDIVNDLNFAKENAIEIAMEIRKQIKDFIFNLMKNYSDNSNSNSNNKSNININNQDSVIAQKQNKKLSNKKFKYKKDKGCFSLELPLITQLGNKRKRESSKGKLPEFLINSKENLRIFYSYLNKDISNSYLIESNPSHIVINKNVIYQNDNEFDINYNEHNKEYNSENEEKSRHSNSCTNANSVK